MIAKTLVMKVLKTYARDNRGHVHQVVLELKTNVLPDFDHKWILRIEGTPGHWYMSTLLERPFHGPISIHGDWSCENFGDVLKEALTLI